MGLHGVANPTPVNEHACFLPPLGDFLLFCIVALSLWLRRTGTKLKGGMEMSHPQALKICRFAGQKW